MSDKGSIRSGLFTTIYDYDRPLLFRRLDSSPENARPNLVY